MSARDVSRWTLQLKKLLSNEVDLVLRLCADVTQLHETLQGHLGHLVADKRSPRQASARCFAFAHNLRTSFVLAPSVWPIACSSGAEVLRKFRERYRAGCPIPRLF